MKHKPLNDIIFDVLENSQKPLAAFEIRKKLKPLRKELTLLEVIIACDELKEKGFVDNLTISTDTIVRYYAVDK